MSNTAPEAVHLRLQHFEGPFDLLFHLIEKNQVDIYDIPIVEIANQYMDYLDAMQEMDLEIASEFLVMAATLLHIKSRMLLPVYEPDVPADEEDPREALILKLVAYKRYKEFSAVLAEREAKWHKVFYKLPEVLPEPKTERVYEVSVENLKEAYRLALQRYKDRTNNVTNKMDRILRQEKVSLKSKVKEILLRLTAGIRFCFNRMFNLKERSRMEVATGFLALLEVVKLGRAEVTQNEPFGEIFVEPHERARMDDDHERLLEGLSDEHD